MAKTVQKLLLTSALFLICMCARSQCTTVCGTVTTKSSSTGTTVVGTVTVAAKGNYTVATSYSVVSAAATNTITTGALSVSVSNVGDNGALFNGTTLPSGTTLNIEVPNATLPQYTYNCLTSTLIILVNR